MKIKLSQKTKDRIRDNFKKIDYLKLTKEQRRYYNIIKSAISRAERYRQVSKFLFSKYGYEMIKNELAPKGKTVEEYVKANPQIYEALKNAEYESERAVIFSYGSILKYNPTNLFVFVYDDKGNLEREIKTKEASERFIKDYLKNTVKILDGAYAIETEIRFYFIASRIDVIISKVPGKTQVLKSAKIKTK